MRGGDGIRLTRPERPCVRTLVFHQIDKLAVNGRFIRVLCGDFLSLAVFQPPQPPTPTPALQLQRNHRRGCRLIASHHRHRCHNFRACACAFFCWSVGRSEQLRPRTRGARRFGWRAVGRSDGRCEVINGYASGGSGGSQSECRIWMRADARDVRTVHVHGR